MTSPTPGPYRSTGADLPLGDPLPWHGVSMEGYFWRLTDPDSGRVVIALIGINTPQEGPQWATVGIAAEPGGLLRTAELPAARANPAALGAWAGRSPLPRSLTGRPPAPSFPDDGVLATASIAQFALEDSAVSIEIRDPRPWPRALFGGSSYFQTVPGLNQYWHPWLLGGSAHGHVVLAGERIEVDGWQVYGEKNWGRGGFPEAWWWGQAQGFDEPEACVAFAGGVITAGPEIAGRRWSTEVTALVVALPDGRVVRLGNPVTSPVQAEVSPGSWRLRGRSWRWQIEVDADAPPDEAFVLPVPLVEERRNAPGDLEHLRGHLTVRVREFGREVWSGQTHLAALEIGGRDRAEAELARRGGDPSPL
ncbi:MAG: tocopherol cyclase family protein [bacterium]|nr:tocopherol cyclase family protein [bacterium]